VSSLAELRASILYSRKQVDSWTNESFVTPLERAKLKGYRIALAVRLKNLDAIERQTVDPEEIEDSARLCNVYSRRDLYLKAEQRLPFLQEPVRQLEILLSNHPKGSVDRLRIEARLDEATFHLGVEERWVSDWKRLWPEWQEWYYDVAERVIARASAREKSANGPTKPLPDDSNMQTDEKNAGQQSLLRWNGSLSELGEWIHRAFVKGHIPGDSPAEAISRVSKLFEHIPKGKTRPQPVKPKSCLEQYRTSNPRYPGLPD
jgi:hypothetical protein